jgi:hypothetical protein
LSNVSIPSYGEEIVDVLAEVDDDAFEEIWKGPEGEEVGAEPAAIGEAV